MASICRSRGTQEVGRAVHLRDNGDRNISRQTFSGDIFGAGSQGFIFINATGGIIVEENGLLFADKFIAVTDASTNHLRVKNALGWWNAARTMPCGDYAQVPMRRYRRRRLEAQKTPRNKFHRRRFDAEWLYTGAWLFGADRLLLCTVGEASGVQIAGKVSTLGNGCSGGYKTGQSPYPGGGGNCLQATAAGGGGGHGGAGGASSDKQAGGKAYGPLVSNVMVEVPSPTSLSWGREPRGCDPW